MLFTRDGEEYSSEVDRYVEEFKRVKGKHIGVVDINSVEGYDLAGIYGITRYPALVAAKDDGEYLKSWQGLPLPLMDEVSAYIDQE